jgi:soluble lytic murein transglycosylase-like protein
LKTIKIQLLFLFVLLNSSFVYLHYEPISKEDYYIEILKHKELTHEIFYNAEKYNIEPELLIALSMQESDLNQYAIGRNIKSKDLGFFQLNDKYFNSPLIFDVKVNTFLGVSFFDYCLKSSSGNVRRALYKYNSGKEYAIHDKAEKRADLIIQTALRLKYNYERYQKTFTVEYFK